MADVLARDAVVRKDPSVKKASVVTEKDLKERPAVAGMNDIIQMTDMICTFTLDDGRVKVVPFSMTYMAVMVAFLGFSMKEGYLICDDDATVAANFEIPEVARVRGYKSMRLTMQFLNDTVVELDLTPTQMFIIVAKFEFDVSDPAGTFYSLSDEDVEKAYLLNADELEKQKELYS